MVNTTSNIQSYVLHTPEKGATANFRMIGQGSACQEALHHHLSAAYLRMV
jgi:hypothetical protein